MLCVAAFTDVADDITADDLTHRITSEGHVCTLASLASLVSRFCRLKRL